MASLLRFLLFVAVLAMVFLSFTAPKPEHFMAQSSQDNGKQGKGNKSIPERRVSSQGHFSLGNHQRRSNVLPKKEMNDPPLESSSNQTYLTVSGEENGEEYEEAEDFDDFPDSDSTTTLTIASDQSSDKGSSSSNESETIVSTQPLEDSVDVSSLPPASFSCRPKVPSRAKSRIPLIIFSPEYSGASILSQLLHETALASALSSSSNTNVRHRQSIERHVDFLDLHQLYNNNDHSLLASNLWNTANVMAENCLEQDLVQLGDLLQQEWVTKKATASSPEETLHFLRDQGKRRPSLGQLFEMMENSREDPLKTVEFLTRLPFLVHDQENREQSSSIVAMNVLDTHLKAIQMNPATFVSNLNQRLNRTVGVAQPDGTPKSHFIILWRQNMLESFVAHELLSSSGNATNLRATNSGHQMVTIDQARFESFVQAKKQFLHTLGHQLKTLGVPFHVLEYERDLSTPSRKERTKTLLRTILNWKPTATRMGDTTLSSINAIRRGKRKQSDKLPLEQQIRNWEQVKSWGYGDGSEHWANLFGAETAEK